ncbi:MAG: hypothetical protein JWP40_1175 [Blastococcus sp.]|nr:hypothetical protein [Blastococcus sp.]
MRRSWSWIRAGAGACLIAATLAPSASAAAADDPAAAVRGPVVVVGVPGLTWQDVQPGLTPALWRLAGRSSVAAMTDRTGEGDARRAAGWLTFNTGSRARADVEPRVLPDPTVPGQLERLHAVNRSGAYRSQVGALGDALHRARRTVATVGGAGAVLGAMSGDGRVDSRDPTVAAALQHADVVVVELPQLYDVDRQDTRAVHDALSQIDTGVATALQALPGNASLLVAGVSDAASGRAPLHVAMAAGPTFGPGRLSSASTGRAGVVQLIDVAPTVLWLTGAPVPTAMLGVHWSPLPDHASTASRLSALVELDQRSAANIQAGTWYDRAVAWVALLYVVATITAWAWRRASLPLVVSTVIASVPVAGWLAQLVPWWHVGTWPLAPLTALFAGAIGSAAAFGPWSRHDRWRAAAFVGAVTAAVIIVDAATGSPLSLDAPFGDNPIVAGRFHGIGNVAFALLGAGTLMLSAAVVRGSSPRRAAATVVGLGAVALLVDGLPGLGDDFGGVLGLLPAVAVLALVVSKVRFSWRYPFGALLATVMTAAAFALYDYTRPPSERTHLGRFIGQIADGSAWTVVARKFGSSTATFMGGAPRWIVVVWLVLGLATYVGHRRGWLSLRAAVDHRVAGGLLAALLVLAVLGAGFNDSGLSITAFAFYVAAPLLVPLVEPVSEVPPPPSMLREIGDPGLSRS